MVFHPVPSAQRPFIKGDSLLTGGFSRVNSAKFHDQGHEYTSIPLPLCEFGFIGFVVKDTKAEMVSTMGLMA
jgi:hypothetical protein